ncbi:MAG: lysophospholipid acyltransferase family protein [Asticcacaulis sp.]
MSARDPSIMQRLAWRIEAVGYDLAVALIRLMPVDMASDLGAAVFKAVGPLTGLRKLVAKNLDLAFPEKDAAWKARVTAAQWDNLGRTFAELTMMDRISVANGRVVVENMARLDEIATAHSSVVFISGHFANFEIMPLAILEAGIDCQITYRAINNPYIDARVRKARARYGVTLFAPKGGDGAREILSGMAKGQSAALMNDQKFNRGVKTPFFGRIVETAPGPAKFAQRFGTVLQPMSVHRLDRARFRVVVHDPLPVDDTGDRPRDIETTVCKVSRFIEDVVRERPEEWFWVHKRWPNDAYSLTDGEAQ